MSEVQEWVGKRDELFASWGSRSMPPEQGGAAWAEFFTILDPEASWFRKGRKHPGSEDRVSGADALATELADGVLRNDTDHAVMDGGGYLMNLWNGNHDAPLNIYTTLGSTSEYRGNSVTVESRSHDLRDRSEEVFASLIDLWSPDYAIWGNWNYDESQGLPKDRPVIGWQTYLTGPDAERASRIPLPAEVTVREYAEGVWITTGSELGAESMVRAAAVAGLLLAEQHQERTV